MDRTTPLFNTFLHVDAASASSSTDAAFGMQIEGDGRVYLATEIQGSGQVGAETLATQSMDSHGVLLNVELP